MPARPGFGSFKEQSVFDLQADGPVMTLVSNPPYGKRLATDPDFLDRWDPCFENYTVGELPCWPAVARLKP